MPKLKLNGITKIIEKNLMEIKKDKLMIFIIATLLSMLTMFLGDAIAIIQIAIVFLLLIFIDYNLYKKLDTKIDNVSLIFGILLVISSFILTNFIKLLFPKAPILTTFGSFDFILLLFGLTILFYGLRNLKHFIVPLGISCSLIIINYVQSSSFGDELQKPFAEFSTYISGGTLKLLGYDVMTSVTTNGDPRISLAGRNAVVVAGCSGFSSFIYYSIITSFLFLKIKGVPWKKILVLSIGITGILFVNSLRVTILMLVWFYYGLTTMRAVHANLGEILFIIYVGIFWFLTFRYLEKEDKKEKEIPSSP